MNEFIIDNGILTGSKLSGSERDLILPDSVKEITGHAFWGISNINSVIISNSVNVIRENAFLNCIGLKAVYIPRSVKEIEKDAFSGCPSLEIYLEGRQKSGYTNKTEIKEVEEHCISPEDDAFNFHRSSGGWSYTTYIRKVEVRVCWNPENYKVHSYVKIGDFQNITGGKNNYGKD